MKQQGLLSALIDLVRALAAPREKARTVPVSSGTRAPPTAADRDTRRAGREPYRVEAQSAAGAAGVDLVVKAPGNFNRGVVGEQFYQPALEAAAGGYRRNEVSIVKPAILASEDDNPHDPNAVRVEIDGQCVGYLAANDAARFRKSLAAAGHAGARVGVAAKIRGGLRHTSKSQVSEPFRVRLDMTWPLTLV